MVGNFIKGEEGLLRKNRVRRKRGKIKLLGMNKIIVQMNRVEKWDNGTNFFAQLIYSIINSLVF